MKQYFISLKYKILLFSKIFINLLFSTFDLFQRKFEAAIDEVNFMVPFKRESSFL